MKRLLSYLLPGIVLATACAKSKTDILPGNKPTTANLAASTVRLVHGSQLDLVMNNTDTLTNWVFMNTSLDAQQPQPRPYPTPYFPGTGKLSGNYFLPQQFLDAKGQAIVSYLPWRKISHRDNRWSNLPHCLIPFWCRKITISQ